MEHGYNVTGIPTDLLIIGFATLCAAVGSAMWHELRVLRREANTRSVHITAIRVTLRAVCAKLDIPFSTSDAED